MTRDERAGSERDERISGPLGDATGFTLDSDGFACTRVCDEPEVWRVELLMGQTFLPSVNVFVLRDGEDTLIVDTGTPDDYNDTRLMRALVRLGVDPSRAMLFCTHAHVDHAGQARELAAAGVRVVVSAPTASDMRRYASRGYLEEMVERLVSEGCHPAEATQMARSIWSHVTDPGQLGVEYETVEPGGFVRCGRWALEVVAAPGHTPGQCALWLPERRIAFTGDVVLFACSTCISFWGGVEDSLGEQLATLEHVASMGVEQAFLGHGSQEGPLAGRARANIAHHERRSARALSAVGDRPGSTGFELVPALGWHAPFDRWEEVPVLTRWFLVSESIAHLDHLVCEGRVERRIDADGVARYFLA